MSQSKNKSLGLAIVGVVLGGLALLWKPETLFVGYLQAYGYVLSISLGCLGLMLLHGLVGGDWGVRLLPFFRPAVRAIPWVGALFIPIILGMEQIYPWAREAAHHNPLIQAKAAYLNVPFFLGRAAFYFLCWTWMGIWAVKNLPSRPSKQGACGGYIILLCITMSFASFDWFMSTEPEWFSSIYGGIFLIGAVISALTFCVVMAHGIADTIELDVWQDFGKLMLMGVMVWAYFNFSQYLIIWSAQLPEEMVWYHHRMVGGWNWVGLGLITGIFFVPFLLLLARSRKRQPDAMLKIAILLLVMRAVDFLWLIAPGYRDSALSLPIGEVGAYLAVGGAWWFFYSRTQEDPAVVMAAVGMPNVKGDKNGPQDQH